MDNAIVVNKTVHGTDVGLLFKVDINNVHGFGVALGLVIVALACILAKCLFLYYIQVHAPSVDCIGSGKRLQNICNT